MRKWVYLFAFNDAITKENFKMWGNDGSIFDFVIVNIH